MDGVDLVSTAEEFGTPLYVVSRTAIDAKIAELKRDFTDKYPGARAAYASKAFLCVAMCRIIDEAGLALDVVSGGELYTAIRAGFPPGRIEFHGNNKTRDELALALDHGIGRIIVDAPDELALIEELLSRGGNPRTSSAGEAQTAQAARVAQAARIWGCGRLTGEAADPSRATGAPSAYRPKILFRVNPGVDADTHGHIMTGHAGSKFGFPADGGELYGLVGDAIRSAFVDFGGIHFHVGSQIFTNNCYLEALSRALGILKEIKERYGCDTPELNIGGGFAIRYTSDDEPQPYGYYLDPVMRATTEYCAAHGIKAPNVTVEPGRSIVGEAGVTLYTVGAIRETRGGGKFVAVDGGMTDNIRPALYCAKYEAAVANKAGAPPDGTVAVVGKCCESGDRLIEGARLPAVASGDILAVYSTGAYGYSMANNYNKLPLPAVAMTEGGKARLIVKRQSYEDLISRDVLG
jgi:diaminopimelate decarboxylase